MPHHDDRDDLSALDFSAADEHLLDDQGDEEADALDFSYAGDENDAESAVAALSEYAAVPPEEADSGLDAIHQVASPSEDADAAAEDAVPLFTVTNPGGTVSVSALLDGRIHQIELSPTVTSLAEVKLAEEILVLADLARQKGLAGQYTFVMDLAADSEEMAEFGVSGVNGLAGFLTMEDGLNLPTPAKADAAQADVFASRYAADQGRN